MRINFIIPFKRLSGGIRVVFLYANYLTEKRIRCSLLCTNGKLQR